MRLAAGVGLILANPFFVTTEFALPRQRQLSRKEMEGSGRLQRAWEMTEQWESYLTGCQLGIVVSSILLGVIAEPAHRPPGGGGRRHRPLRRGPPRHLHHRHHHVVQPDPQDLG